MLDDVRFTKGMGMNNIWARTALELPAPKRLWTRLSIGCQDHFRGTIMIHVWKTKIEKEDQKQHLGEVASPLIKSRCKEINRDRVMGILV